MTSQHDEVINLVKYLTTKLKESPSELNGQEIANAL